MALAYGEARELEALKCILVMLPIWQKRLWMSTRREKQQREQQREQQRREQRS
jgi:hypothetical protein